MPTAMPLGLGNLMQRAQQGDPSAMEMLQELGYGGGGQMPPGGAGAGGTTGMPPMPVGGSSMPPQGGPPPQGGGAPGGGMPGGMNMQQMVPMIMQMVQALRGGGQ